MATYIARIVTKVPMKGQNLYPGNKSKNIL